MIWLLKKVVKFYLVNGFIWFFLTTVLPNLSSSSVFTHNVLAPGFQVTNTSRLVESSLVNSNIYYIIAHPDDEVMFFSPSILELNDYKYNNDISIICFSTGNADGLGSVRSWELYESARFYNISKDHVFLIDSNKFQDGMNLTWDAESISQELGALINFGKSAKLTNLVTFDSMGVSNHSNHKSLYHGTKLFFDKNKAAHQLQLLTLNSMTFYEKYSYTVITNFRLLLKCCHSVASAHVLPQKLSAFVSSGLIETFRSRLISLCEQPSEQNSIFIYANMPNVLVTLGAMSYAYKSQMVWFRWGWLLLSSFVNHNELAIEN